MAAACASFWLAGTGVGGARELSGRDEARHCVVELHVPASARSHVVGCEFAGLRPNSTANGNLIRTGEIPNRKRKTSGTRHCRRRDGSYVGSSSGPAAVHVFAKQTAMATTTSAAKDDSSGPDFDCVIVGGGISGLCTAQALATQHGNAVPRVLVTEARERVGGNITTVESEDGYLWEEGPNSFQPNESMLRMVVDSGLTEELVLADPDSPRFVFWDGELRPVPAGLADLPFFNLLSPLGKIRAGLGALGIRPPPPPPEKEESVEEFVRRNLGSEVFERLIEPFCSGVYAGNPANLSMKAAFGKVWRLEQLGGSIIGGTLKLLQQKKKKSPAPSPEASADPKKKTLPKPKGQTVGSFQKGLITLPKAIAQSLGENKVKINWKLKEIKKLSQKKNCRYHLIYDTPDGSETISTNAVVLTVPAYIAADLIRPLSESSADSLASIYYPPVAAVTISYPISAIREDRLVDGLLKGFGQLHPRSQGIQTLGTIYSSSLFPNRAPEKRVLLLNYIGGATYTQILSQGEEEIVQRVDADLRNLIVKKDGVTPCVHGVRVWPRAIPQFNVGHLDSLEDAKKGLVGAGVEGLFLGGNYVAGVALGRCVEAAYESAEEISKYVSSEVVV